MLSKPRLHPAERPRGASRRIQAVYAALRSNSCLTSSLFPPYDAGALFGSFLGGAEHRVVRIVNEGLVAFGRHGLGVVDGALDVVAPDLARQFVQHLDAVAVRIDDVEAVRHAVVDAALELDPL